jgi:dihydrolipoamide dehydrogenase
LILNEGKMRKTLNDVAVFRMQQYETALRAANVRVLQGHGSFIDENQLHVHNAETGEYHAVTADYFIIATGSKPRRHPHYYTNKKSIITSDEIMSQDLPKSIVIIGAGVIGCEFASILANFGKTQVHIIEKADRILPMEDADISGYQQALLEAKGVIVHKECKLFDLQSIENEDGTTCVHYAIQNNKTKALQTFQVERALISIGRVPNYKGLGLENTKCKVTDGRLTTDKFGRCTPHNHIFAVGDATMDIALVNMGEYEARCAIDHIYSERLIAPPTTENLSTIMFLDEEVAAVGYNEKQLREKGSGYLVARYGYEFVSRAVAMGDTQGFVKIIVTNDNEKRVLGVRAIGPHASSVVELASLAIRNNQSAYDLAELMTAYPAITQGFQECVRMLLNRSILKPNTFPSLVMKEWHPMGLTNGRPANVGKIQGEERIISAHRTTMCNTREVDTPPPAKHNVPAKEIDAQMQAWASRPSFPEVGPTTPKKEKA